MSFNESNTVEQMILDAVENLGLTTDIEPMHEPGADGSLGAEFKPSRWIYVPGLQVPRQPGDVIVELWLREALVKLNPEIAAQPDRADEVIYALRATVLSVAGDGLVRANENFMAWLRGEKTMPFGRNGEHVSVRLIDFEHPQNNRFTVVNQWSFNPGHALTPVPSPTGRGVAGGRGEGPAAPILIGWWRPNRACQPRLTFGLAPILAEGERIEYV